jgi:hypothetical protein
MPIEAPPRAAPPQAEPAGRRRPAATRARAWRPKLRWFAAEFLVVVSGVLVALAANDWAQRAREQRLVEEYRVRIIDDLDRIARSLELVIAWTHMLETSGAVVLPVLERGAVVEDSLIFVTASYQLSRRAIPDLSPIAYRELLSTGQIRLFRDSPLQQLLGNYFADLERGGGFLEGFPDEFSAMARGLLPLGIQFQVRDRCPLTVADPAACTPADAADDVRTGVERLLRAPHAAEHLRHTLHSQRAIRSYMERQYELNRSLRQELDDSLPRGRRAAQDSP